MEWFSAAWLLSDNVKEGVEMKITNTGVNLQEPLWLSTDVSAYFKHRRDSEHILLAQVAGYNKVYQIIW